MQLYEHMFVYVTVPDLELRAAMDASAQTWPEGTAVALDPGDRRRGLRHRQITHVNRAARIEGVRPGMTVGLAVDVCPGLRLLRPDPVRAVRAWDDRLRRIEGLGAEVESPRIGSACFDPTGLIPLYGGLPGLLKSLFEALGGRCLVGAGPTRLAASMDLGTSAGEVRAMNSAELQGRLDTLSLDHLRGRLEVGPGSEEDLISSLRWLGMERLGELRQLGRGPATDRFGVAGTRAWDVASGREEPLRPRRPEEEVRVTVEVPDDGSSIGLSPALAMVCSRLAASLAGIGRAARSVRLEAELRDGGSWRCERSPKVPTSNPDLLRIPFEPALESIPGMPAGLSMVATSLTGACPIQSTLFEEVRESRRRKIDEAVRQVKAVVGSPGLLKVVEANPRSRLPERRVMLVPCDAPER